MRILVLADLHIGNIQDTVYVYNTLTDVFEKQICFNKTDMVVIAGDYFHRLFKVNEEYVSLAINIMTYLIKICAKKKIKIRLVYGTESHEMNQYKLFNYHFSSKEVDIKVIDTVTEENINGKNILYIPEEFILDKEKYYKEFFNKQYDYIFGHGVIIEGMPMVNISTNNKNNNTEKKVPYFKSKDLSNISKVCVFGHYHQYTDLGDNCYYLGSFFRNCFGEEIDKGYGIIEDDKFTFIKNDNAYIYKTYVFDESSDIYTSSNNILTHLKNIKEENKKIFSGDIVGKIRLVFNIPDNIDVTFKENLRNILSQDKLISILLKESNKEILEDIEETDEFEYILDNSLNIIDKIHMFINKQYDYDMDINQLSKYIQEEFNN